MGKICNALISLLGGLTYEEWERKDYAISTIKNAAIERLNKENERLNAQVLALQHAIEDSRATGSVNVVRIEKPIHTIRATYIVQDEYDMDVEMKIARQATYDKIRDVLRENDFVDFKTNYDPTTNQYNITGTLTIVEK